MEDQLLFNIVENCKKGDKRAQSELYRRYYREMYNVSLRILKHTAEAEDAMQEGFIAAFKQLNSFRGDVNFGGWLKKIVINRSIDQLRKRKNFTNDLSILAHQTDEPPIQYDEEVTPEIIKKAINSLNDNYRIVLSLFLLEGYDHDEIAEILKISNGSSRTIYHRAKEKLKLLLEEHKKEILDTRY
jgi:RNA polymerase sigma factor (sigma-70 family)